MKVRIAVGAAVVVVLGVVAYYASIHRPVAERDTRPETAASEPQTPPPATNRPKAAGTMPYQVQRAEQYVEGTDAPFDPAVARRITAADVKKRLDAGQQVVFIDTRPDPEGAMIEGAVQVTEDRIGDWGRTAPKSAFIVIYCTCADEATAAREVLALQKLGFKHAFALRDGLLAWEALGLPTQQPRRADAA